MNFTPFIYYLVNSSTGLCYYKDINGVTQQANIHSGIDVSLPDAPNGWDGTELGFNRNSNYHGINRSFAEPLKFIKGAADIIRELLYNGNGIETPLSLSVFKYNDQPLAGEPNYKLYYKGQLDLPKFVDIVDEGVQLNLMEGGISQLLKAYENTIFEIPCDGSRTENQKVLMDGLLVEDIFNYTLSAAQSKEGEQTYGVPVTYISNEGDNFGIIHNDPAYQLLGDPFSTNNNYMFKSARATSVRITGTINARPRDAGLTDNFTMYLKTSKSLTDMPIAGDVILIQPSKVSSWQVFSFDQTINLVANEALFPPCVRHSNYTFDGAFAIEGGTFQLSFSSMAAPASVWAITAYDLFKMLVKAICDAASTTNQTFDYGVDSTLLQANLNWFVTSGDALRASSDPNYAKFYKQYSIANTTGLITAYGVVIKTCLADFYKDFSALLCASLGNQQLPNSKESIYFEALEYAFNDNANIMDVGEVSTLKISLADEVMFNSIEIGHQPQSYDQKSGKYEYNGTTKLIAPIKSIVKSFSQITKYRRDTYGMQRLIANIGDTSTTRNDSDSSVFAINVDRSVSSLDTEKAYFISAIPDQNRGDNTNNRLVPNTNMQPVTMTDINGTYLSMNTDPSIFVISSPIGNQLFTLNFLGSLTGNIANAITGNPADSVNINLFINGAIVRTFPFVITNNTSAPISGSYSVTQLFNVGDSFYLTATTSINGIANLSNITVSIGAAGNICTCTGLNVPIEAGSPWKMIALPSVVDSDVNKNNVHYGFQYFMFDNILINSDFSVAANVTVTQQAGSGDSSVHTLYKNGLVAISQTITGNQPLATTATLNLQSATFKIGDLFYLLSSSGNLNADIIGSDITFTSSNIRAYGLKRVQYDSINGVPNLARDVSGNLSTTVAGAPYNIEDTTPKRMLEKWGAYIRAALFNQSGNLQFATASKNQFLSTSLNGKGYTENTAVSLGSLAAPLWYPLSVEFETKVPANFADLMTTIANSCVRLTYNGVNLYGFPITLRQKPALNETQSWKLRLSTKTNLNDLLNLNIEGLNLLTLLPNSLFCSVLSPLQYVEVGKVLDPRFHKMDMGQYWFIDQIKDWANSDNYWQPWQQNDTVSLQFVTNGIAPVSLEVFRWDGKSMMTIAATPASSNAVITPYYLWEVSFALSTLPPDTYYTIVTAGIGANAIQYISEGLDVRADWPQTMLFEYTNSKNAYGVYFDTGFSPSIRVHGMIGQYQPEYKAAFSIGQRQDATILNAYPYKTYPLMIGRGDGIPDWVCQKLQHVLLCNNLHIENMPFSLDEKAKLEAEKTQGQNKQYWKTIIRPSKVSYGLNAGINGGDPNNSPMIASLDASSFGINNGNTNGTIPADIIQVTLN